MPSSAELDSANAMLRALEENGPSMSNPALRKAVGLNNEIDTYLAARDILIEQRLVTRGPGQGGTLRLVSSSSGSDLNDHDEIGDPRYHDEEHLYAPMASVIERHWSKQRGALAVATQVTAHAGSKDTGGAWSRPDITTVELRTFTYVPGRHLEVITFEVKPVTAINVQGVYEALAHRRHADRSFLLLHVPLKDTFAMSEAVDRVGIVAREQGIGLIIASEPSEINSWTQRVPAARSQADPEYIDYFIATQMHDAQQKKIAAAVSGLNTAVD